MKLVNALVVALLLARPCDVSSHEQQSKLPPNCPSHTNVKATSGPLAEQRVAEAALAARNAAAALPPAKRAAEAIVGNVPPSPCSATTLETLAVALHANERAAEALKVYREAAAAVRGDRRYRGYLATLLDNIVRMCKSGFLFLDQHRPVPEEEELSDLLIQLSRDDPKFDRYQLMRAYVGELPSEWYFGPRAGAALLHNLAVPSGVYNQVFRNQFYERHALDLLGSLPASDSLVINVSHELLADIGEIARQWGDSQLMTANLRQWRSFIDSLKHAHAKDEDIDGERAQLALLAFESFGQPADIKPTRELAARLSASNRSLADNLLRINALQEAMEGRPAMARQQIEQFCPDRSVRGACLRFDIDIAGTWIAEGQWQQARSALGQPTEHDRLDLDQGALVRRLLAAVDIATGDASSASHNLLEAFDLVSRVTESPSTLEVGRSTRWESVSAIRNAAITWALRHRDNVDLARLATTISIESRQLDTRSLELGEAAWDQLAIGRSVFWRRHANAWASIAHMLQDLPHGVALPWEAIHRQLDEINATNMALGQQRSVSVPDRSNEHQPLKKRPAWAGLQSPLVLFALYQPYDQLRDAFGVNTSGDLARSRVARAWIAPGQDPRWEDLGSANDFNRETRVFVNAVRADDLNFESQRKNLERAVSTYSQVVFGSLVESVLKAQRVLIIPDGAVELAPLSAVLTAPVGQRSPILRLVERPEDLAEVAAPTSDQVVLMTGADRAIGNELPELAQLFHVTMVPTGEFNVLRHPAMLHIATHGTFLPRPDDDDGANHDLHGALLFCLSPMLGSRLQWSGTSPASRKGEINQNLRDLTAFELAQTDLHGTGLAVLAACESGSGNTLAGEGVFGLRRALAIAGAQRSVTTLWRVDDSATSALMVSFYQSLHEGVPADEALRKAQDEVRQNPRWKSPYYWAGFIIAGAPGSPIPSKSLPKNETGGVNNPVKVKVSLHALPHALPAAPTGNPTISGKRIFVPVDGDRLLALDAQTGTILWSAATRGKVSGAPAVSGDVVVAGDSDGIAAWAVADGKALWTVDLGSPVFFPELDNGKVYATTRDDRVVALSARGTLLWSIWLGEELLAGGVAPKVSADSIYASDLNGRIVRLDKSDGRLIWASHLNAAVPALYLNPSSALFASTWSGEIFRLDPETGSILWRHAGPENELSENVLLLGHEIIYRAGFNPLVSVDTDDGHVSWQFLVEALAVPWGQVSSTLLLVEHEGVRTIERITGTEVRIPAGVEVTRHSRLTGEGGVLIAENGHVFHVFWECRAKPDPCDEMNGSLLEAVSK